MYCIYVFILCIYVFTIVSYVFHFYLEIQINQKLSWYSLAAVYFSKMITWFLKCTDFYFCSISILSPHFFNEFWLCHFLTEGVSI